MPSQIPCGSAIETEHVHYGPFLLFLKLAHQSVFLGHVSVYCPSCVNPETAYIFQSSRQQHSD